MLLARSYSHHSLLSAVPKIPDLIKNAISKGYTSIALTDEETGSGLIELYDYCNKLGIKPILGSTLKIPNISNNEISFGRNKEFSKVAILPKNTEGYKSLLKLITKARTIQETPTYHITLDNLEELNRDNLGNFFVLIAGNDHELITNIKNGKKNEAEKLLKDYIKIVGQQNLLVELALPLKAQPGEETKNINLELIKICKLYHIRYVASPAPRYLEREDDEAFRVVLAIRSQKKLSEIDLIRDYHLPTISELQTQFEYCPEALVTQDIEDAIDIKIRTDYGAFASEAFFPPVDLPPNQTYDGALCWESYLGLLSKFYPDRKSKLQWKEVYPYEKLDELKIFAVTFEINSDVLLGYPKDYWTTISMRDYTKQIEYELKIIKDKGYSSYFLVLADIAEFCRENDIIASARGSGAGSLVGFLNNISTPDTIYYQIPFERFLNPLRPSAPDIDMDIADDKREQVLDYLTKKYGSHRVCQIITFGTMLPRAAVRDVGRVLGVSYKKCDRLSKLIPIRPLGKKATFEWAFGTSNELVEVYERDEECGRIIDIAKKIEENYRHASVHAAGLYITPTPLIDYCPLQWDSDHTMVISQYDWHFGEAAGLIKIDLLGIRNLSILGNSSDIVTKIHKKKVDLLNIDLSDKKTFDILSKGRTMGTFQLSSGGMTRNLIDLKPNKIQDLMAMVALYRPGPMANIPEYIKRRNNPKLIKYYVPEMKEWMDQSYGVFVYQEDVLFTAVKLAGYNFGEADNFRRALGKKKIEDMNREKPKFFEGCKKHGLAEEKIQELWDLIVPFSDYGFNKAHSGAYGIVAYWTAYMKANYPAEFMTAYMTAESSNLEKVADAINECKELSLTVLPPDINYSFDNFSIQDEKTIRYGLSSVKNLGSDVIKFMINEREKNGQFNNMDEFLGRISPFQGFNKRSLEALIWSGSLDKLGGQVLETVRA